MQVNLNKIKGLMAENGDTQKDLARKLGVNKATVNNWLHGKTNIRLDMVNRIAEVYKVTPLILITLVE